MTTIVALISFAAGASLTWFAKTRIQALVIGGTALAARLKADAAVLEAKANTVKAVL